MKASTHMGLEGTIFTIAASPDLMNFWFGVSDWQNVYHEERTYGRSFDGFTSTTINLLQDLRELASNVGGVAIQDWGVTSTDLTRVVKDDDLGVEGVGTLGGVVLGVTSYVTTTDFLDGNVLDVEADVVTGDTLGELLVVHLNGLDFGGDTSRGEGNDHTSLDARGY